MADDVDWACGIGAEVAGPAEALTLVMTGRPAGLGDLTGPGLPTLTGPDQVIRPVSSLCRHAI
jgi:hypothetical protein